MGGSHRCIWQWACCGEGTGGWIVAFCNDRLRRNRLPPHIRGQRGDVGSSRDKQHQFPRLLSGWAGLCVLDRWCHRLSNDDSGEPCASKPQLRHRSGVAKGDSQRRSLAGPGRPIHGSRVERQRGGRLGQRVGLGCGHGCHAQRSAFCIHCRRPAPCVSP